MLKKEDFMKKKEDCFKILKTVIKNSMFLYFVLISCFILKENNYKRDHTCIFSATVDF